MFKKIIVIIVILILAIPSSVFIMRPNTAKAQVDETMQEIFKALLESIKKRILDTIVNQTIAWIQGGGTPGFVTDFGKVFRDSFQAAVGDTVLQTNAAFLCSPFSISLMIKQLPVQTFGDTVKCTLNDIVGNLENFANDFNSGGWVAYGAAWDPNNNGIGEFSLAINQVLSQYTQNQAQSQLEINSGQGFLSTKVCKGGTGQGSQGDGMVKDSKGEYCYPSNLEAVTPGAVAAQAVSKAVGTDIDYILNAQSLVSYLTAIFDALINRALQEGLTAAGLAEAAPPPPSTTSTSNATRYIAIYQAMIDLIKLRIEYDNAVVATGQQMNTDWNANKSVITGDLLKGACFLFYYGGISTSGGPGDRWISLGSDDLAKENQELSAFQSALTEASTSTDRLVLIKTYNSLHDAYNTWVAWFTADIDTTIDLLKTNGQIPKKEQIQTWSDHEKQAEADLLKLDNAISKCR